LFKLLLALGVTNSEFRELSDGDLRVAEGGIVDGR